MSEDEKPETVVWKPGQEVPSKLWPQVEAYRAMKNQEYKLVKARDTVDKYAGTVPDELLGAYVAITDAIDQEFDDKMAPYERVIQERFEARTRAIERGRNKA